uniref:C2 domain-containing protein n=1 Tax=Phaeomonas parva TaxID=124430 RepID=A0A7S1UJC0_9STRA|mmetsp:Transcript_6549/g.18555  ORF Transcript_6549/g.18555 Transcript_6549/m.18555 type:complete len:380 (+) Transcript_6549:198-1337(+)|eukprot:CAMPEP_0118885186 /NCGR_PEP_ID=MMETSP1163-20130328/23758_1 /TAXON_ID=124430 /ORGANISM="Phaeomonas parva, Strain CCMP2877" /LENGTH=379 /DNA_ID=CAMNT_0006823143 /DNA_START=161 /DNA_END=1300 /DNA_ORIENTATION=+
MRSPIRRSQSKPATDEDQPAPRWVSNMSYRGNAYRYLDHQQNVMGTVHARVVEAKNLRRLDWSYLQPLASAQNVNPYVKLSMGGDEEIRMPICTGVVRGNCNPTWVSEKFILPVLKSAVRSGIAVTLDVQAFHSENVVARVLPNMITGNNSLGLGQVELSALLLGEAQVLDVWVPLQTGAHSKVKGGKGEESKDEPRPGAPLQPVVDEFAPAVHIVVEYEPEGLHPQRGDIVYLEPFARSPVNQIIPPGEPMAVIEMSGSYALVGFQSGYSEFKCQLKIHRNAIFVVERLTLVDGIWKSALAPTDYLFGTRVGRFVRRTTGPYVSYVNTLLAPVYFASNVGIGTVRLAVRSAAAGVAATGSTVVGNDRRNVRRTRRVNS